MPYYFTLPNGISLPADLGKVSLTTGCELHRDDSAVPNALTVANGEYNVFVASNPTFAAAEASGITRLAATEATPSTTSSVTTHTGAAITAQAGTNRCAVLVVHLVDSSTNTVSVPTWGAASFTSVGSQNELTASSQIHVFRMLDATIPAGAQTVSIVLSEAASGIRAYLIEYENVNQTTPFGTPVSAYIHFVTSTDVTVNMTSATGRLLSTVGVRAGDVTFTMPSAPASDVYITTATGLLKAAASDEVVGATGNETHSYSIANDTGAGAKFGVEILPV